MDNYQLYINGDNSILIEFSDSISLELTRLILGIKNNLDNHSLPGFIESVPAYNKLLVIFKAENFDHKEMMLLVDTIIKNSKPLEVSTSKQHIIPVCYDESVAPDLMYVANYCKLSIKDVIERHSGQDYPVFMLGFLPGFLYLGDLDSHLHCPRRDEPRPHIEAGSVGIGGTQTGIYPVNSPGGWQIIGKTPVTMFNPNSEVPSIARPLDTVRFNPISLEEFKQYGN